MAAGIRLLLAITSLVATLIDPSEPSRFVAVTYGMLAVYSLHAALLYAIAVRRATLPVAVDYLLPWVDVAVYAVLIGLSGGSNSIYFVLFYFGILVASFQWGFGAGVAVTATSVLLFIVVSYATRPADPQFDLNRFLLRSTTLPVLGYLIAYRGGYELRLRRRLSLLRDISTLSNPRFGPHHMLARSLESLRDFFDADLAITLLAGEGGYRVLRTVRGRGSAVAEAEEVPAPIARHLLSLDPDAILCFRPGAWRPLHVASASPAVSATAVPDRARCESLAEVLGVPAYLTVPLRSSSTAAGRLYVCASVPRFDTRDGEFLLQVADQIMPSLAHLDLVERMATRAAEDERQRIALDIHDRVIQPYIGLQIGLAAVEQVLADRSDPGALPLVRDRLTKLAELTRFGIADLRGYVRALRGSPGRTGGLADSLRRFSQRFHEATGILVAVDVEGEMDIDDRLAAEVFSMACEAVSNVRRHTTALEALVTLRRTRDRLVLRVENAHDAALPVGPFLPLSIAQRAAAVSGTIAIESTGVGPTVVTVAISL
jgi:signal transduction histidine kinase